MRVNDVVVRTPSPAEFSALERFLEAAYGHSFRYFSRSYPHLYRPDPDALDASLVAEQGGAIVSHVGAFPLEIAAGPARIPTGGIGGVATVPQVRGQGLMSRLMREAIARMRRRGNVLSVLWGDRQRYRHFGYEVCGVQWNLTFTPRSLAAVQVKAAPVAEADPNDPAVAPVVGALHRRCPFRVERPRLDLMLRKEGVRVFLGDDGYALVRGERGGEVRVLEVVSARDDEPGLVAGIMAKTFSGSASLAVFPAEGAPARRLVRAAARWSASPQGLFRILDWPGLAVALRPLLEERARFLAPFELAVGCRDVGDDGESAATTYATLRWDGRDFAVEPGRSTSTAVEVEQVELVGLLLGGPYRPAPSGILERLFPVPVHVPLLDHV